MLGCGAGTPPVVAPSDESATQASAGQPSTEVSSPRADASVLPRQLIFGNPDRTAPRLSPDGKRLAWLAPRDGVLNVYVARPSLPRPARDSCAARCCQAWLRVRRAPAP